MFNIGEGNKRRVILAVLLLLSLPVMLGGTEIATRIFLYAVAYPVEVTATPFSSTIICAGDSLTYQLEIKSRVQDDVWITRTFRKWDDGIFLPFSVVSTSVLPLEAGQVASFPVTIETPDDLPSGVYQLYVSYARISAESVPSRYIVPFAVLPKSGCEND